MTYVFRGATTPKISVDVGGSTASQTTKASSTGQITSQGRIIGTWDVRIPTVNVENIANSYEVPLVELVLDNNYTEIDPDCIARLNELKTSGTYQKAVEFRKDYGKPPSPYVQLPTINICRHHLRNAGKTGRSIDSQS